MSEIENLHITIRNNQDRLANVITIKTKYAPVGIVYIKRGCLELELIELNTAIKKLSDVMKSYKIITEVEK